MTNIFHCLARLEAKERSGILSASGAYARLAFLAAFVLPCFHLHAAEADFKGVKIPYENATVSRPDGDGGDIVFTFSDPTKAGSLTLPGLAKAWVLVVGGGGAGGSGATTSYGAGGGGGAGGYIEQSGFLMPGGTYSMTVGVGGTPGADGSGTPGGNGGESAIFANSTYYNNFRAYGGGGGGIMGAGAGTTTELTLASGGGGSASSSSGQGDGGIGFPSQGNNGGNGLVNYKDTAAGGGGAGGAGGDSVKLNGAGKGGDGFSSSISGQPVGYAGGGGGGTKTGNDSNRGKGGAGGGGNGGGGTSGTAVPAESGTPGTGGGGGGGTKVKAGGAGGSGVVIVRLSDALSGALKVPESKTFTYDGENHIAVTESAWYVISTEAGNPLSVTNATEAGEYSFKVKPIDGVLWSDNTSEEKTVAWKILPKSVTPPSAVSLTYNRGNQTAFAKANEDWVFVGLGEGNNATNATNAGSYYYVVQLKDDRNYVWSGVPAEEAREPRRIDWTIAPESVPKPSPKTGLVYNGQNQVALEPNVAYVFTEDSVTNATDAGYYSFWADLANPDETVTNYVWKTDDGSIDIDTHHGTWQISVAVNQITKLSIVGWKTASAANDPVLAATWGAATALYRWAPTEGADVEENWSEWVTLANWKASAPTEVGNYQLAAKIEKTGNYGGAEATTVFALWDNPNNFFADFVPVTVTNKGAAVANVKVTLKLSEKDLPGFSYARVGDSRNIAVILADDPAHPEEGELMPFNVVKWDRTGESEIEVVVPAVPANGSVNLILFWSLREGKAAPVPPDWPGSYTTSSTLATAFGLVSRDGTLVNYWKRYPSISPTYWDEGTSPEIRLDFGELAVGGVTNYFYSIDNPEVTYAKFSEITAAGGYRAVCDTTEPERYGSLAETFDFHIVRHESYGGLGGSAGGRVLLMNNDGGDATHPAIDYQGCYDSDASNPNASAKKSTTETFWQFLGTDSETSLKFNLKLGTESALWTANYGRKLWHLMDCRHGNTFPQNDDKAALESSQNYLNWNATSRSISRHTTAKTIRRDVGQIVMRNVAPEADKINSGARVYSSCFTNGVGTIYFDAVNGWNKDDRGVELSADCFQLKVYLASNCVDAAGKVVDREPTDENVNEIVSDDVGNPVGTNLYRFANWQPADVIIYKRDGTADFKNAGTNTLVELGIQTGGTFDRFYRLVVPVNTDKAVRFMIRRESRVPETTFDFDEGGLILLDNILVSPPANWAELDSYGDIDLRKTGTEVLGWEGAFDVTFPSAKSPLTARAKPVYHISDPTTVADPAKMIVAAKMHYRWRYLDQKFVPPREGGVDRWNEIDLRPAAGLTAAHALPDVPEAAGDVEYWYEATLQAPFFSHVDYSGHSGLTLGGYTEEISSVVNRQRTHADAFASGGHDWFVRLREGASDYRAVGLVVNRDGAETPDQIPMTLVEDHVWRGFLPTPTNEFSSVSVRFFAETADGAVDAFTGAREAVEADELPFSGAVVKDGSRAGTRIPVDAKAGYLMFTLNESEEKRTFAVTRADRQNFNYWTSAHFDWYVGSASDTNYVSATVGETNLDFFAASWSPSVASDPLWTERFQLAASQSTAGFEKEKPFVAKVTPAGWLAEHAMFTYGQYAVEKTLGDKFALQLEGCGNGSVTYQNATKVPEGLDTITLHARLAQFYQFGDFAYNYESFGHSNMTFLCRAAFDEAATKKSNSYQGEPAVSLVAHYRPGFGCYEARFTRPDANNIRLTFYRWRVAGTKYEAEELFRTDGGWASWTPSSGDTNNTDMALVNIGNKTTHSGLFFTTKTDANGNVLLLAGVSKAKQSAVTAFSDTAFRVAGVWDAAANGPIKSGTFGAGTRNCPGVIVTPVCYVPSSSGESGVPTVDVDGCRKLIDGESASWKGAEDVKPTFTGDRKDCAKFDAEENWYMPPGRLEPLANHVGSYGLQAATDIPQTLNVQIREVGKSDWTNVASVVVKSFTSEGYELPVRTVKSCDVRLAMVGDSFDTRVDVTIDDVSFTQWCGKSNVDYSGTSGMPGDFVYTCGWVTEQVLSKTSTERALHLQPTRADATTTPVSLRTPLLRGFGMFSFSWKDAHENAKLIFQVASNNVGTATLRTRTKEGPQATDWQELATIDYAKMSAAERASGATNFYLNVRAPAAGVLRVVVAPDVVAGALKDENRVNVDWGSVTVTRAFVRDMPEFDYRSWTGWNFRTTGWEESSSTGGTPNEYANLWDATRGLSAILNNTADKNDPAADLDPDAAKKDGYKFNPPYVQTPTMFTNCIGEITFSARLYDPEGFNPSDQSSYVTVWGCTSGDIGEASAWKFIGSVEVRDEVFRTKTVKAPTSESFRAVRLGVAGAPGVTGWGGETSPKPARVLIDDVVVTEQIKPSVTFRNLFVRPFRDFEAQKDIRIVQGIETTEQQPMLGETFGFQAEVEISQLADDVDLGSLAVEVWYYPKAEPWGYENWRKLGEAQHAKLVAAEGTNLIFRSSHTASGSYVPPPALQQGELVGTVQYHMQLSYRTKSGDVYTEPLSSRCWTMPSWYAGIDDPNAKPGASFSAFTLLEELMPHRVWINEVQYRESDPTKSLANQWIELAVPQGVELKGWELRLYDYTTGYLGILARFGNNNVPTKPDPSHPLTSRYGFLVLKSPDTQLAEADGNWTALNKGTVGAGRLSYQEPYGIELVRPSGIIEHQVVVEGDNPFEDYWFGVQYSGTNLVRVLREDYGGNWFFAGKDGPADRTSVSAITNAPVASSDWVSPLDETPARANVGQTIDPEWFTEPNGETIWIYANLGSARVRQYVEGVEQPAGQRLIVQKGDDFTIEYRTDGWWALTNVLVNGASRRTSGGVGAVGRERSWTYTVADVQGRTELLATPLPDASVLADPDGSYAPAIMSWLKKGKTGGADGGEHDFVGEEIQKMYYRGIDGSGTAEIDLTGMYWLDVDPTDGNWELWGGMGDAPWAPGTLGQVNTSTNRTITLASGVDFTHTNRLTTVWLMLTNTVTGVAYAPYRLQGLGNEQSDNFSGAWTSANFKVTMALLNGKVDDIFRPMRYFVFGKESFRGPDDPVSPFAARIEITDPFSRQSPAVDWGWWRYPMDFLPTQWSLDKRVTPDSVTTLKKDDFLEF